jgi:hypothetical protein
MLAYRSKAWRIRTAYEKTIISIENEMHKDNSRDHTRNEGVLEELKILASDLHKIAELIGNQM